MNILNMKFLFQLNICHKEVPEGTSVFDTEPKNGTDIGEFLFIVHGLTRDMLDTMTTNTIKVMVLHHLNNKGNFLAVGHRKEFESMWNNSQLYYNSSHFSKSFSGCLVDG